MEQENTPKSETEIAEDLQRIREWLQKQPHLPKDFDDDFIISYIKQCKSLEKVKKKIDAFCTARTNMPKYFQFPHTDILDPAFRKACKFTNMFFLPEATPENYRVFFTKGCNVEEYDCHQAAVRIMMMMEVSLMKWPDMNGIIIIMDVAGGDSSIISKFDVSTTYKAGVYLESSSPLKMKNLIMINSTSSNDFIINNIIKPFLKNKMTSRIMSSTSDKILKDYVPISILPKEYEGGTAPSSQELNDEWLQILEQKRDWFAKYSKFCSDENKRPADSKNPENMMNGSFKYLSID
ncbi:alpha-tocopherol transfer protein-like [Halyomorpha halys]|uniref:alpha-tocopherol transfer protein-like n=1 Tax=Halyomorpha halys TaxID=286706 RepID=UPI0006D50168|nr:uncharacterized protein LOC106686899 [Halyomorpha halys]XP_014285983.1 uncharacterized protein LOC106686899 [Halyomorpha halys]